MLTKLKQAKQVFKTLPGRDQKKDDFVVALDIGTENVKALIGRITHDTIEIVGVGRSHQELSDMQAGAIADIQGVVANCDQALAHAEEQAGVSVRTAVIGIAGELVKGTTTTVTCTRKKPDSPLDMAEVERIIAIVQAKAQQRAKQQLSYELGGKQLDIRLVNSALVSIDIDGYAVTNPVGFQGKEVVVQLYTAFAPMIHIGALERTAQELDLDLLAVAAEPFAVARSVIGNDPNASMSAILMDVGGGTTDIAVINDGGVQGTKMFGIGGRAFTRSIERDLAIDFPAAERIKLALPGNTIPKHTHDAAVDAIDRTLDVWIGGVDLALGEFTHVESLPNRVLLCGGGASLEQMVDRLENTTWFKQLPFTKRPVIQLIQPQQVASIVDTTGSVTDHTYVTAMGLLRVGADTLQQNAPSNAGSVRQKIDRMLKI